MRPVLLVAVLVGACSFESSFPVRDAAMIDAVDAPSGPVPRWLVVAHTEGPTSKVTVIGIRENQFETPCPTQPIPGTLPFKDIAAHPNLPYVYGLESGFYGTAVTCGTLSWSGSGNVTASRPIQRIGYDAMAAVGFFTGDGSGSIGVYRFTTAADGTPTLSGTADATAGAGGLALDASRSALYVVGASIASSYDLVGATLDLPANRTNASTCSTPQDVVVSGDMILDFCSDSADVRRYSRTPFQMISSVPMGTVDRVIALPNDRAIAARTVPDLAVASLASGNPTWGTGQPLGSRITALTAATDGTVVVSARLAGASSELVLWKVDGQTLSMLDTTTLPGVVSATALTIRPL